MDRKEMKVREVFQDHLDPSAFRLDGAVLSQLEIALPSLPLQQHSRLLFTFIHVARFYPKQHTVEVRIREALQIVAVYKRYSVL